MNIETETSLEELQDKSPNTVNLSPGEELRINKQGVLEHYHEGYWTEDLTK